MFLISISTAMNVFVLNINERGGVDGRPVPPWLRGSVFNYLAIICCVARGPCPFSSRRPRRDNQGNVESHELRYKACHNNHNMSGMSGMSSMSSQYVPQRESILSNTAGRNVRFSAGGGGGGGPSYGENDVLLDDRPDRMTEYEGASERRLARLERAVEAILKHLKAGQKRKEKAATQKSEWAKVAKVLDRVLLVLYLSGSVATSLTLMLQKSPFKPRPEPTIDDFVAEEMV